MLVHWGEGVARASFVIVLVVVSGVGALGC